MYDIASYQNAKSVGEAIGMLTADDQAVVICGGSDVLIKIREGKLAGCPLVCIRDIAELNGVKMDVDGAIVIGPTTTFAQVTHSEIIQRHIPALGFATDQAGGPQLRNIGTIGGNVCNGMTSADSASTLLTLNAELLVQGSSGQRRVKLADFYAGPGQVHLAHDELLVAIRIAKEDYAGYSGHYIKYAMRNAMDIATLGCAVHVKMRCSVIEDVRLAFGVAAPVPVRCPKAEAAVRGEAPTAETFKLFGETALTEVSPRTSWRASKEFRIQLVRELSGRCLRKAIENGGGAVG